MEQALFHLNNWFKTPLGRRIADYLSFHLEKCLPNYYGQSLLQLGLEQHLNWLQASPIKTKQILTPYKLASPSKSHVIGKIDALPFESHSVDVLFAPFCLECIAHTASPLAEFDRILKPGGFMLLCGVNPMSFWGVPKLLPTKSLFSPWQFPMLSPIKLRGLLQQRGYDVEFIRRFYFAPPFLLSQKNEHVFEKMGKMLLPYPAGFYLISAQKITMRLSSELQVPSFHFGKTVLPDLA